MPYTITHNFISTLADGTVATKVKPSNWNSAHAIAGSLGANEITNIPAGAITATDVQAAINQLVSLIPAPGPGTDPLFLTQGLTVDTNNPTYSGASTESYASKIRMTTDFSQVDPVFGLGVVLELIQVATHGQNTNAVGNNAKQTMACLYISGIHNAAGQHNLSIESLTAYGMGDTSIGQQFVQYAGGPVNGDEGVGFRLVCTLNQQPFVMVTSISGKPAQSTVNTVTTQIINKSKSVQTVTVADTTGAVIGDWVVIDHQGPSGVPTVEAVQIINFTPTSITGVFDYTHASGVTVTPALRISCPSTYQQGQDRLLINMSAPSYLVGTVSSIDPGPIFVGNGTAWADNMVGGEAMNIGAITLAADDNTFAPFDAGANRLRSWYQISAVTDPTHLTPFIYSGAGPAGYTGRGPGSGSYVIRPCAKILRVVATAGVVTGELICDTSTSPWNIGDTVECSICPYPDVSGFQYHMAGYTNGGTYRRFMQVINNGARTFQTCFEIIDQGARSDPSEDPISWGTIFECGSTGYNIGLNMTKARVTAIQLASEVAGAFSDNAGLISWGGAWIIPNSVNGGLTIRTPLGSTVAGIPPASAAGELVFRSPGASANPDPNLTEMEWNGYLHLARVGSAGNARGYITIDSVSGANFERGFLGWDDAIQMFEIGTDAGVGGTARDLLIKPGNVETLRFTAGGGPIKFSDATSFSANGAVATNLGSVGPAGANTTVQKWLTIKDNAGGLLYIPCF